MASPSCSTRARSPKWWWWVFVAGLAAFFITMPFHLEIFVILEMSRFFGLAMLALSMGFLWGFSGILSFGQTAFFGLGGYGFTVLALNTGETTGSVFFAVALGAAGAGILGYFMIYGRISEIYLSVITLVFTLILEKGIRATSGDQYVIGKVRLNGQNGIPTVPQLDVPWNPSVQLDINWFFWVGAVLMILVYIGLQADPDHALRPGAGRHPRERAQDRAARLRHAALQAREPSCWRAASPGWAARSTPSRSRWRTRRCSAWAARRT